MALPGNTNFRIRGIPLIHEKKDSIRQLIKQTLNLDPATTINIHSLAVSPSDHTSRVAIISFPEIPGCFSDKSTNEWPFHLRDGEDLDLSSSIVFDTHFRGFTPFQRADAEDCHVDIVAVTGLGGHALGSFKQKNGPFVWLRDGLPVDAPNTRILSYGYDTKIVNSRSFQNLTDLARSFQLDLEGIQDSNHPRPIVFIAHSLGGLLVKETIVQMRQEPILPKGSTLDLISGFMFFGVPHQGLAVECLVPMIRDSPNRALLESLGKNSALLSRLQREFSSAMGTRHRQVVSFYETERSLTARQVEGGGWEIGGPSEVLVEVSSANCGSLRQHPINRNHSEMVKFSSRQDDLYQRVVLALKPLVEASRSLQTFQETRGEHHPIISLLEDEKRCLQSLSFQEQDHRYAELRYDKNTCEWLLQDEQYQAWLNAPRGPFWIKGSPGTGKSVLMKFAVGAMQRQASAQLIVSFFVHGRGVLLQRTPLGALRALLSSLLGSFPSYLKVLTQQFNHREERFGAYERKGGWDWTEPELEELLSKVLVQGTKAQPVTIYIDALDECGEDDAKRLLQYLSKIMSMVNEEEALLKVCFSSRHYPILGLETMPTLSVEERNGHDIKLVVQNRLKELDLRDKRQHIESDILAKAQGGFQWAILVIDIIRNGVLRRSNSSTLLQEVTKIPETLQDLYEALLSGAKGEERAEMVKLLQWVLFSQRPLSAHELREALATSHEMTCTTTSQLRAHPNYSDTVSDFEIRVRHISRGLVEFHSRDVWEIYQTDGEDWDREAQFIHQSVADFVLRRFLTSVNFRSLDQSVVGLANFVISRSCIKYITLQDILESSQLSRRELSVKFPLLPYVVTFLLPHINLVEGSNMAQTDLLELFQWYQPACLRMFSALWLKLDPDHSHAPMGWPFVGATAPHFLVGLRSFTALQTYLNHHTVDFNARDSNGNTPLLLALGEELEDLALLLLDRTVALQAEQTCSNQDEDRRGQLGDETGNLNHVNAINGDGETPLGVAVSTRAHEVILSLLVAGADPKTEKGLLFYAIGSFDKPLVADLIKRQVCLDGAVFFAVQTLRISITTDQETASYEILSTLLSAGANTGVAGGAEALDLLDPDSEDDEDEDDEAIFLALRHGYMSVVKLLIMHGVSTASRDSRGVCLLQTAADNGYQEIAEFLYHTSLETGQLKLTDILEKLYNAMEGKQNEFAAFLLSRLYRDGIPAEILMSCVSFDNVELTEFMLGPHYEIRSTTDDWPESALQVALNLESPSCKMVELLLTKCEIDLSIQNDNGETPLQQCLAHGSKDLLWLFLDIGKVDIHKEERDDGSPFWWAIRKGSNSVIELLLGLDVCNIIRTDWAGLTAFWWLTEGRPYDCERIALAEAALHRGIPHYRTGQIAYLDFKIIHKFIQAHLIAVIAESK